MTKLKVIMVVGDYPPIISGVGDPAALLSRALTANGIKVTIITTRVPSLPPYELSEGIEIFRVVRGWFFSDVRNILRLIDKNRPATIVHIHYHCPLTYGRKPMINLLPAIIRILRPCSRVVVTHHDFNTVSLRWKARVMPMLLAPHGVIVVNSKDYYLLNSWLNLIKVRSVFIPPTSNIPLVPDDLEAQVKLKKEYGIKADEVIIAFFGGIRPDKGFDYLLNAVRELNSKGLAVRLLVIGGFEYPTEASSPYAHAVRKELELGESEQSVILARPKYPESVSRLFKIADLAVFPFINGARENNGSLLAALINRVPVITTRGLFTPPDFERDYGVETVPAGDYHVLLQRIKKFTASPEYRMELRSRVLKARQKLMSWEQISLQTMSFYFSLFNESK